MPANYFFLSLAERNLVSPISTHKTELQNSTFLETEETERWGRYQNNP